MDPTGPAAETACADLDAPDLIDLPPEDADAFKHAVDVAFEQGAMVANTPAPPRAASPSARTVGASVWRYSVPSIRDLLMTSPGEEVAPSSVRWLLQKYAKLQCHSRKSSSASSSSTGLISGAIGTVKPVPLR